MKIEWDSLDEAIDYFTTIADGQGQLTEMCVTDVAREQMKKQCEKNKQLASWLTELKEAKRLLRDAHDDIAWLNEVTLDSENGCLIENNIGSCNECPLNTGDKKYCGWRHQVEALKLIGDEECGL